MVTLHTWGGDPNNNSGYILSAGQFAYTDGITMPSGNLDSAGQHPILVESISSDYQSKGRAEFSYRGYDGPGPYTFTESGGGFRHKAVNTSAGQMNFGRNTANGGTTFDSGGGSWAGGLCGQLAWATVPQAPTLFSVTPQPGGVARVQFGANHDGYAPVTGYLIRVATNAQFTDYADYPVDAGSNGIVLIPLQPGKTYWFSVSTRNTVSDSLGRRGDWGNIIAATMISGGKVRVAGAWKPAIVKVRVGGAWKDAV